MANITNYKSKWVECDKCGWVGTVAKHLPIRFTWCGGCGSLRVRLHKARLTKRATDAASPASKNGKGSKKPRR